MERIWKLDNQETTFCGHTIFRKIDRVEQSGIKFGGKRPFDPNIYLLMEHMLEKM